MVEYSVHLTIRTDQPASEATACAVADIGGVASLDLSASRIGTTVTTEAADPLSAAAAAVERITAVAPGTLLDLEVMTSDEFEGRLDACRIPRPGG